MVYQIVVGALTWFHIFSVIGWSGAALTFLVSIKPSLAKFSPAASGEFILKVLPRFVRSVQIFSALTLIFGPSLAYAMSDGPPNAFDLKSPWSILIVIGASRNHRFLSGLPCSYPNRKKINTCNYANSAKSRSAPAIRAARASKTSIHHSAFSCVAFACN
jgi:hypothetical protein